MKLKKMKIFSLVLCGLMLVSCSKNPEQQKFETATQYVDAGGEAFLYSNTRGIETFVNKKIPATVQILTQDYPNRTIASAVDSLLKLINVKAFQAYAASSVDCGDGLYLHKQFLLIDRNEQSIFINPKAKNVPMDWKTLPADTRAAFKANLNLAHVWAMIKQEFNPKNPLYKELASVLENPKVNAALNSFEGDVEFLLTGTTLRDAAFSLVIPDNSGKFLELAKNDLKLPLVNNKAEFPIGRLVKLNIEFKENKMFLFSKKAVPAASGKTLADLPQYQKFAKVLPRSGYGYVVLDIPQSVYDQIKAYFHNEKKVCELIDLYLKPISLAAVSSVGKDGCLTTTASNFSLAQVQQVFSFISTASPATGLAVVLPALQKARSRARSIACVGNLKQLGIALSFYNGDHKKLPTNLKELVRGGYISPVPLKDLIYLAPYGNFDLSSVKAPSNYVVAVCNRKNHDNKTLAVLYLDGHVEIHNPGYRSTLDFLKTKYKLNQTDYIRIARRLAEAGK